MLEDIISDNSSTLDELVVRLTGNIWPGSDDHISYMT